MRGAFTHHLPGYMHTVARFYCNVSLRSHFQLSVMPMIHWPILVMGNFTMTSSNGNIFSVTGPLCGEFTPGELPSQRAVTRSFDIFIDLRLKKRLCKQSRRRWVETPSRSLWRHFNVICCNLVSVTVRNPDDMGNHNKTRPGTNRAHTFLNNTLWHWLGFVELPW